MGKVDRESRREYVVLPSMIAEVDQPAQHCGVVDLSELGARARCNYQFERGAKVNIEIRDLRMRVTGQVVRIQPKSGGYELGIKFDEAQPQVPGLLLEHKLRSRL